MAVCVLLLIGVGRIALHERDERLKAEREAQAFKDGNAANEAGLSELDSGARNREVIYVQVAREVAAAGPVSEQCKVDPAYRAASAGMLRMRADYCALHPERCTAPPVPDRLDR